MPTGPSTDVTSRPKARMTVWVTPPPLRCVAVTRMDTKADRCGAFSVAFQVPLFSFRACRCQVGPSS